ncbi:hypothetical protein [Streptomyces sp. NPDC058625]|uniref:hypothetical protein n=1 Tax=Streptomyces sp. NPDC058625 TaxID=3346564 RepID=UPI00366640E9
MKLDDEAGRVVVHLAMVGCLGSLVTALHLHAVPTALFIGNVPALIAVCVVGAVLSVALFAGTAAPVRLSAPLIRGMRGRWAWAARVYALGTAGAGALVVVHFHIDRLDGSALLYPQGGLCYTLAAALVVPRTWTRVAALGTAAVLAWAAWAAAQPPTLDQWLTANGVDRALLRVGEPPAGYALHVVGASQDGFGAGYEHPGAAELHLTVKHVGFDTRRQDARGCPVPLGETLRCTDDGGGRLLLTDEGDYGREELRLHRDGLVYTVTAAGDRVDLAAARRILSTLRPATDAELAALVTLPMRR